MTPLQPSTVSIAAPRLVQGTAGAHALFAHLTRWTREMAAVAYVDADGRLLGLRHVSGGIDHVAIPVRSIVRDALAYNAAGVIVAHNHPSGDVTASRADIGQTRLIASALRAIDVRLFDALILSGEEVASFRAMGLL